MKKSIFSGKAVIKRDSLYEVFSAVLGKAMLSQTKLGELVVKGRNWGADLTGGTISFGDDSYPVQFIGNESTSSDTWLWGYENVNNYPESVISLAEQTKQKGEELGLEILTIPEIDLTDIFNGHLFGMLTCGLSDENICYYRGPHANGAVVLGVSGIDELVYADVDVQTFVDITMQSIQSFTVDHKIFIESFLYQNNTEYNFEGDNIIAHFGEDLKIKFEKLEGSLRIANMETVLKK